MAEVWGFLCQRSKSRLIRLHQWLAYKFSKKKKKKKKTLERAFLLLVDMSKHCWTSGKQSRPWSDATKSHVCSCASHLQSTCSHWHKHKKAFKGGNCAATSENVPFDMCADRITKTHPFKYIENFTAKKLKIFGWNTDIFHISCPKHRLLVLVRTASPRRF